MHFYYKLWIASIQNPCQYHWQTCYDIASWAIGLLCITHTHRWIGNNCWKTAIQFPALYCLILAPCWLPLVDTHSGCWISFVYTVSVFVPKGTVQLNYRFKLVLLLVAMEQESITVTSSLLWKPRFIIACNHRQQLNCLHINYFLGKEILRKINWWAQLLLMLHFTGTQDVNTNTLLWHMRGVIPAQYSRHSNSRNSHWRVLTTPHLTAHTQTHAHT